MSNPDIYFWISLIEELHWIDIKFEFNFPVEAFPNIIKRVRGTPVRLGSSCASRGDLAMSDLYRKVILEDLFGE